MSSSHPVLDNEDKSPIPDLSTFMSTPVASAQSPMLLDVLCTQNLATPPMHLPKFQSLSAHAHLILWQPIQTDTPPVLHEIWQSILSGITDQAHAPEPEPSQICSGWLSKPWPWSIVLDKPHQEQSSAWYDDVPNAILQMAYNRIYVLLSMLTTSSLAKFTAMTFEISKNSFWQ